ncbi:hypothetical protein AGOR_G00007150, partial [Albula goreensis]
RIPKDVKKLEDNDSSNKRRRKGCNYLEEATNFSSQSTPSGSEGGEQKENKVKSMATQLLAKFEENAPSCTLRRQGSFRREFPQNLGGSDMCHFCKKRVYVMERLSAEGRFFHRECFRCDTCSSTLRVGGHAFDSEQGKFYCKLHFAQRKRSQKFKSRTMDPQKQAQGSGVSEGSRTSSPDGSTAYLATGTLSSQPPGGYFQHLSNQSSPEMCDVAPRQGWLDPNMVAELPKDSKQAQEAESPTFPDVQRNSDTDGCEQSEVTSLQSLKPCTEETLNKKSSAQPQECATSEGPVLLKKNNRWRRKIRATFPLVLVKTQDTRTTATDKSNHSKTSEEEDSDFEEIFMPASENRHLHQDNPAELENPPETTPPPSSSHTEPPTDLLNHHGPSTSEYMETENTGKKKLTLSLSEKEKLLDWELGVLREESSESEGRTRDPQYDKKPEDEHPVDPPPAPAPTQSTLQIVMNTLRRSFRVPGTSSPHGCPQEE